MELKVLEREKNSLKIEITEPDETLIHPLVDALLKNDDIADAQYYTGHPQLDKPVLYVKTKKGDPQAALKRSAEALSKRYSEAKDLVTKALAK